MAAVTRRLLLPVLAGVLAVAGAKREPRYPLFYLTPHSTPPELAERMLIVPRPLTRDAPPLLTNRMTLSMDPEEDNGELEVTQFHTQDAMGRFIFGFHAPDQVRMEARDADGSVRGSYSYVDPNGNTVKMEYWDEGNGFQVRGDSVPGGAVPGYTPEVAAARAEHFRLYQEALAAAAADPDQDDDGARPADETNGIEVEVNDFPVEEDGIMGPVGGEEVWGAGESEFDQGGSGPQEDYMDKGVFNPWAVKGESEMGEGPDEEEEDDSVSVDNPNVLPENLPLTKFWSTKDTTRPKEPSPVETSSRDLTSNPPFSQRDFFHLPLRGPPAPQSSPFGGYLNRIPPQHHRLIPIVTGPFLV